MPADEIQLPPLLYVLEFYPRFPRGTVGERLEIGTPRPATGDTERDFTETSLSLHIVHPAKSEHWHSHNYARPANLREHVLILSVGL
jgi:hypothetical protein